MSIVLLKQALFYGINELMVSKIDSARLDAEILLGFVLGISREKMLSNPQYPVSNIQYLRFKKLIAKRKKHHPIAYLTGSKEFYGINFYVNESVLVPRPETELLVEETIRYIKNIQYPCLAGRRAISNILELGTGSGCISITLAKYLPKVKIVAVDISEKALSIARKNRSSLELRTTSIQFKRSNLLSNIKAKPDIIVANLPYLTRDELGEPSIKKEPKLALYGGRNGLEIYERLFGQIKRKWGESPEITLFLEIGEKQAKKIREAIRGAFPNSEITVIKDLSRKDRVIRADLL
jgi:release factor glutamine methyltransferase